MLLEVLSTVTDWTWILTVLIGLVTYVLIKHILVMRSLPPGPFPLPFAGNLLAFRGKDNSPKLVLNKLADKYKKMYTIWLGPAPTIVVNDWELCREGLLGKKNDFNGRVIRRSVDIFLNGHQDVMLSDFGPCWETLRKILHLASRKYSASEKLSKLVSEIVDIAADQMLKEKTIDTNDYMYLILYNVLASSTFGKRYAMDDLEFQKLRKINDRMNEAFSSGIPSDAMPILRFFYKKLENELRDLSEEFQSFIRKTFYDHKKTYQRGIVRDFTDEVLSAREDALQERKDSIEYMTDGNLILLLSDLFTAGSDTTRLTLLWVLFHISNEPEIQRKMYAEILENIGDTRVPEQSDRMTCPYTYSVIAETLRLRPVIDFTLEHKTTRDTELGGYKISKDTSILFNIKKTQQDLSNFEEPGKFKPERFLEPNGSFTVSRLPGNMPFGLGRRACPGEKLALADVFLIITRLLQRCYFELEGGPGSISLEPDPLQFINFPLPFKLIVQKRNCSMLTATSQ